MTEFAGSGGSSRETTSRKSDKISTLCRVAAAIKYIEKNKGRKRGRDQSAHMWPRTYYIYI